MSDTVCGTQHDSTTCQRTKSPAALAAALVVRQSGACRRQLDLADQVDDPVEHLFLTLVGGGDGGV
ncbi:MAG: hypothetical protein WD156_11945 [Acidimicrobiia bacterium]